MNCNWGRERFLGALQRSPLEAIQHADTAVDENLKSGFDRFPLLLQRTGVQQLGESSEMHEEPFFGADFSNEKPHQRARLRKFNCRP